MPITGRSAAVACQTTLYLIDYPLCVLARGMLPRTDQVFEAVEPEFDAIKILTRLAYPFEDQLRGHENSMQRPHNHGSKHHERYKDTSSK